MRGTLIRAATVLAIAEAHMLDADHARLVPTDCIGRMLSPKQAHDLLDRIGAGSRAAFGNAAAKPVHLD